MDSSEDEAKQPAENTELLDWFAGQALAGICAALKQLTKWRDA